MTHHKTVEQLRVQAIGVAKQFVEVILRVLEAELQRDVSKLLLVIDQQRLLAVLADEVRGQMDREHRGSNSALGAEESDDATNAVLRARIDGHDGLEAVERDG
jgi:hypothetical protein